jgi:hypothetical protein
MPTIEFYRDYSLYRQCKIDSHQQKEPPFLSFCDVCDSDQTFVPVSQINWPPIILNPTNPLSSPEPLRFALPYPSPILNSKHHTIASDDQIQNMRYFCAACGKFERTFLLRFNDDMTSVEKIGQFPRWSTEIGKPLQNILGDYKNIYRKGLDCEAESYGIGAYAYYRRIIELVIGKLIETLKDSLSEEERATYIDALEATQRNIVAKEKIELIKDMLPGFLRPDNCNPLAALHDILSEGIHDLSEEECLEYAKTIRTILEFLVDQIENHKNIQKGIKESMKKLLNKKSEKIKK